MPPATLFRGHRLLLQFRLRTVFALITAASVPLAFWAAREHRYRMRLAAVRAIVGGGGEVYAQPRGRDPRRHSANSVHDSSDLGRDDTVVGAVCGISNDAIAGLLTMPTIKRLSIGDGTRGSFGELLPGAPIGAIDAPLLQVAKLPALETLDLARTNVTGEGIRNLAGLRSLRNLNLSMSAITDTGLDALAELPQLAELDLSRTRITDDGVRRLAVLTSLRRLNLSFAATSGAGLEALSSLRRLEELDLSNSGLTDEGARHLAPLRTLRKLNLRSTPITGAALAHLSALVELEEIALTGDAIGDDGLQYLSHLPRLARVYLANTRITDEGLKIISRFKALEVLSAGLNSAISDDGLAYLSGMKSLKEVGVHDTSVTHGAAVEFEKLNPSINVLADRPDETTNQGEDLDNPESDNGEA